jgi:hypothetical protein
LASPAAKEVTQDRANTALMREVANSFMSWDALMVVASSIALDFTMG